MEVYVGTQPGGAFRLDNSASSIVKRLVDPIAQSGRNVTMDNWFTSISLIQDLLLKENLYVVGTIRKNKMNGIFKTPAYIVTAKFC